MRNILSLVSFLLFSVFSYSQNNFELYTQFVGKYDFTMIGNTMNPFENSINNSFCYILTTSSADLNLSSDQEIEAAYIYWAGSGSLSQADLNIKLNGIEITPDRTFTTLLANSPVFGAFTNITSIVQTIGNGTYTISDFDLNHVLSPTSYCSNRTNFGGWMILIVYKDENLGNNLVRIYDGFDRVDSTPENQDLTILINDIDLYYLEGNKIAFLAWEGDRSLNFSETLKINNQIVSNPPLNPANSVFNSTNSFTNSSELHNMDLDWFDIRNYVSLSDEQIEINLHSGEYQNGSMQADAIIFNNVTLVLNSEVPDATIEAVGIQGGCDDRDVIINYTVYNTIATKDLVANVPISFFVDGILIGQSFTQDIIPIGGSESGQITVTVPFGVSNPTTIIAHVDNDGTGTSTIREAEEGNNTFEIPIYLGTTPTVNAFNSLEKCDSNDNGNEIFDLTLVGNQMIGAQTGVQIRYYLTDADAQAGNANNIANPTTYVNTSSPQTIYVRMEDIVGCYVVTPFQIEVSAPVELMHEIPDIIACSLDLNPLGDLFDLTINENSILNGNNPANFTITYHLSQAEARSGNAVIPNPTAYVNTASPQTIWVRVLAQDGCVQYGSFQIDTTPPSALTHEIDTLAQCAPTTVLTGLLINLTANQSSILNGNNPADFVISYHLNQTDAGNGINPIPNPAAYPNTSANETIWVRLVDQNGCVQFGSFLIEISAPDALAHTIIDFENCSENQTLTGIPTDLTAHEAEILNGMDPNLVNISYHLTETGARNNIDLINTPTNYTNITSPETIWVRLVDQNGCVQFGSFQLIYHEAPLIQTASIEECSMAGPATFQLTDLNELVSATTNNLIFQYYLTENDAINAVNPLPNNYTPTGTSVTIYVRVINEFGCYSVIGVQLETVINTAELPNTYFECDSPTEPNDGVASFNLPSLQPQINASLGLPGSILSFHLTVEDAETGFNPIPNSANYSNTTNPQTIYARALDINGNCGGIAEFLIEVAPVPEFELPNYLAFCPGDDKTYIFYDPYNSYVWLDPEGNTISTSNTVTFNQEGMHTLIVRETADGCPAERQLEVIFDNPPTITNIEVEGHTVKISATGGTPPYQYSYNNGLTWHDYFILENVPGGIHDLIVKSKYGCISEARTFGVLGIPNFISPNGDGINDFWEIRGLEVHPDAHLQIFDRYGKMFVDRKIEAGFKWDGKYLGNPIPSGDYWYIITITDGRKVSGHISVRNR